MSSKPLSQPTNRNYYYPHSSEVSYSDPISHCPPQSWALWNTLSWARSRYPQPLLCTHPSTPCPNWDLDVSRECCSCSPLVEAHVPPLLSFAASESFLLHSPSKNPTSLKIMSLSYTTHPSSLQSSTNPLLTPSHSLKLSTLGSFSFSSLLLSLFLVTSVTRWIILCYLILLFCNDPFLLSTLINQTFI